MFDDDRFWAVDVTYAKASPTEVLRSITVENRGPDEATLDVLPTLWFRNTWRWRPGTDVPGAARRTATPSSSRTTGWPGYRLEAAPGPDGSRPARSSATTRPTWRACSASTPVTAYPKDGINDHVVSGAATVNPAERGPRQPGGTT